MSTRQCPGGTPYIVKPGDTLWAIAHVRNLSLEAVMRANPGVDPNNLRVGQVICLPVPSPGPGQCRPGLVPYTIQPGDTLFSLQQRGIISSLQLTLRDNPGLDPGNLRVGQVICVPGAPGPAPGVCPQPSRQYVVQPGDTFFSIAQRFGVSVARIQGANPAVNPNNLQVGQVICIPGS